MLLVLPSVLWVQIYFNISSLTLTHARLFEKGGFWGFFVKKQEYFMSKHGYWISLTTDLLKNEEIDKKAAISMERPESLKLSMITDTKPPFYESSGLCYLTTLAITSYTLFPDKAN